MSQPLPDLSGESFEALGKAALMDDPFPTQILLETGSPAESLDPLFDLGLLEESDPGETSISAETIRQAALAGLSWSRKRKLSLALAETAKRLGQNPAQIAKLYLQGQSFQQAREQFVKAADHACQVHEYKEALDLMRRALEIWPSDEDPELRRNALREMARCASNCADNAAARVAWTELLETAGDRSPPAERIELMRQLAQAATADGDRLQARELLRSAATLADDNGLAADGARLWRSLAQAQGDALRIKDAIATLQIARERATRLQDWALLSDTLAYAAGLTAMLGRIKEARDLIQQAMDIALERELPDQITNAYRRQAIVSEYSSNYASYRDTELAALERCRTLDNQDGTQACLSCVSYAFFRLGQYDESLAAISEAVDDLGIEGELRAGAESIRACIRAFRGLASDPASELERARRLIRIHNAPIFEFYLLWAKGATAVLQEQPDAAANAFADLIAFWQNTDDRKDVAPGLVCAASFFAQENDRKQLSVCIDILNTICSTSESDEPGYAFLAATAEDAWANGQAELAAQRFADAAAGYATLRLPFELAWINWRLGYTLCQSGRTTESSAAWRDAETIAHRHGLKPLQRAILRERRKANAVQSADQPLTPRQREIASLIAAGCTNKEAASELGLSPRTVEMHVAALIERLGCRTRTEAAAKASELGLLS